MFKRLFFLGFCFSILFFSVSPQSGRSIASAEDVGPIYDASYKL